MSFEEIVFQDLESIVGPDYTSNDPAVLETYSKQPWPHGILLRRRPYAVVLPSSAEEVQSIYRLANRYRYLVIPAGNYNWDVPTRANTIVIDPKRMNSILEIDENNMFAVVEPGVTHAQLNTEAMQRGLISNTTGGGGPTSVIANNLFLGMGGLVYRLGMGKVILATQWVLPTGEIIRTGSESVKNAGPFWYEGTGPDLRGIMKAYLGLLGGFGMATKMSIKLLPWPGPKTFPIAGTSPEYKAEFPPDTFTFHLIQYETLKKLIDAMYAIGRAEIGAAMQRIPPLCMVFNSTTSKEELWTEWETGDFQKEAENLLGIWLVGFSGTRQLDFEEKVLRQIIDETGGKDLAADHRLFQCIQSWIGEWFRSGALGRCMRPAGSHALMNLAIDSLDHAVEVFKDGHRVRTEYPHYEDFFDADYDWICPPDFGWYAHLEVPFFMEQTEDCMKKSAEIGGLGVQSALEKRIHTAIQVAGTNPLIGPLYGNYHLLLKEIKRALDPNNISNPPNPISIDEDE
jgi:glycolate oxidase